MAALAFCIDTRQQGKLSDAKIVSIIAKNDDENALIPPCDRSNTGDEAVSAQLAGNQAMPLTIAGVERMEL